MTTLAASTDLMAGQWRDAPKLTAAIDAPLGLARGALAAFDSLEAQRDVTKASGIWLDWLGARVGLDRPTQAGPSGGRYGFEGAGTGFDRVPFRGDATVPPLVAMADDVYRRLIQARSVLIFGRGTFQEFFRACRYIDPACQVQDLRNMTIAIQTSEQTVFEIADSAGALPRAAGVLIIYGEPGRWGFESAGKPWDVAPFRGSSA